MITDNKIVNEFRAAAPYEDLYQDIFLKSVNKQQHVPLKSNDYVSSTIFGVRIICVDKEISSKFIKAMNQYYHVYGGQYVPFKVSDTEYIKIHCYDEKKSNKSFTSKKDDYVVDAAFIYIMICDDMKSIEYVQKEYKELNWFDSFKYSSGLIWRGDFDKNVLETSSWFKMDDKFRKKMNEFVGESYWKKISYVEPVYNHSISVENVMNEFIKLSASIH